MTTGPDPGYYPSLSESKDLGQSQSCSLEFAADLHARISPALESPCLLVTSSNAFSVRLEYGADLLQPFSIKYRAIPAQALNERAVTDISSEFDPSVASNGAVRVVAFCSNAVAGNAAAVADLDIWVARSVDNGTSWTVPVAIDPAAATDTQNDSSPLVYWSSQETVAVVWSNAISIKIATSTNSGSSWTIGTIATAPTNTVYSNPTIAFNSQIWVACFESQRGTDIDLVCARSTAAVPSSWEARPPFSLQRLNRRPSISAASNVFVLSWQSNGNLNGILGSDFDILIMESTDGLSWTSSPLPVSPAAQDANSDADDEYPVAFSVTIGSRVLRGVAAAVDNSVSYYTWSPPIPSRPLQVCPRIDKWSLPRLLDDAYGQSDDGSDDKTKIIVADDNIIAVWETSNVVGTGARFPVSLSS